MTGSRHAGSPCGSYHRLNVRRRDTRHIVDVSGRLTIAGMTALTFAMTGAVLLVTDDLFGGAVVVVTLVAVALVFSVLWFGLPLRRAAR